MVKSWVFLRPLLLPDNCLRLLCVWVPVDVGGETCLSFKGIRLELLLGNAFHMGH